MQTYSKLKNQTTTIDTIMVLYVHAFFLKACDSMNNIKLYVQAIWIFSKGVGLNEQ